MVTQRPRPMPSRFKDLAGQVFGFLKVIVQDGWDAQGRAFWLCECQCGQKKTIRSRHLLSGKVISCGCYMRSLSARKGKESAAKISGPRSYLYKPGLTDEDRLDRRNIPELRVWRKYIFERDGYTCQLCGRRGVKIQAHHLYSWAEHPLFRYDVNNGLTLCREHHREFHMSLGGQRVRCTAADYEGFKARWYIDREIQRRGKVSEP